MGELATIRNNTLIGSEEIKILKQSLFSGFSDAEINYCAAVCNELRLSPLLKQIHFVKRAGKLVTQTGIDGFRLTADRTGKYAGSDDAIFEYEGTQKKIPSKATVTTYKMVEGQKMSYTASARWEEYCPAPPSDTMWKKMPHGQLSKCAEALSLRKAFPAELSSVYADEEMDQANGPSKAENLQDRVLPKDASIETTATVIPNEPAEPDEPLEETSVPKCSLCSAEMKTARSGFSWFCPNFNDKSQGEHPRVKV